MHLQHLFTALCLMRCHHAQGSLCVWETAKDCAYRNLEETAKLAGYQEAQKEFEALLQEGKRSVSFMEAELRDSQTERQNMENHYRGECERLCKIIDSLNAVSFMQMPSRHSAEPNVPPCASPFSSPPDNHCPGILGVQKAGAPLLSCSDIRESDYLQIESFTACLAQATILN